MKLFNYYVLNVVAQGLGRVFTFGSNFIAFALVARFYGADFFGQYAYVLNYFGIFVILADFGLMPVLGKDIAQAKDSPQLYWGNFLLVRLWLNILVILGSIITAYYLRRDMFSILLVGSLAIPFLASRFFEPIFQVFNRPWHSFYASIIYGVAHLVFLALAFKFTDNLSSFVIAYISANVLYTIIAFYLSGKSVKPLLKIDTCIIKNILKLAMPLGISSIFIIISNRVCILMLAGMKSDYAVGIYSAAYKFVEISSFLAAMVTAPLIPIFAEKAKNDKASLRLIVSDIAELIAIILLPVGVICSLMSKEIISLVYGSKLLPSVDVFNILIWVSIVVFYSLLISSVVISVGVVKYAYWLGAVAAILSAGLNYLLIPKYSYIGSAWVALICEIVLVGVTLTYAIRHIGNFFRWKTWVKIFVVNMIIYVFLNETIFGINIFLKIITGLTIYYFCVVRLHLIRRDVLNILPDIKIFSFFDALKR
ncbi:MAG TPA: flippase [Syntrophorhabdaceae bacterium]|nr:flippase [Syntrophorhabdaceae bacterium]